MYKRSLASNTINMCPGMHSRKNSNIGNNSFPIKKNTTIHSSGDMNISCLSKVKNITTGTNLHYYSEKPISIGDLRHSHPSNIQPSLLQKEKYIKDQRIQDILNS